MTQSLKVQINHIIYENLTKLKGKNLAPKKLEYANTLLKKLKSPLPK